MYSTMEKVHSKYVFNRRTNVLAAHFLEMLPQQGTVLDVGCGDGLIDHLINKQRPMLKIEGIDVLLRKQTHISVTKFDGNKIPFEDNSFDVVMFVDVLHHTNDPKALLKEAKRVARQYVVIKDHTMDGLFAETTLRFMDWVGNAPHGVVLPYNYWTKQQWYDAFKELDLTVENWKGALNLYPLPANWLFDFIVK